MKQLHVSACFVLFLATILCLPAHAADRVTCYTLWDDNFFYMAVEVQDIDVESANTAHLSNTWEDDCVEVFLETDNKKASDRSPNTYEMSLSAGGGSNFLIGENGQPKIKTIYTYKFAKKIQGTLNRPMDRDMGYTIELAIPWKEIGGPPKPGQIMGFNVVCRMKGENIGFVSLSPDVVNSEDIQVPAKWSAIKFVDNPTIIAMQDGAVVCRKVNNQSPLINGNLGPGEWIRDMRFQLVKPEPTIKQPVQQFMIEKLALTPYYYHYQGDPRKEAPYAHVRNEDGSSRLTDQPMGGAGPWFSYDQVQWHKNQLSQIRNAGIDVVLPVYSGDSDSKKEFASKGLSCMVQAMKELKAEGRSSPLVGMSFGTPAMRIQYGWSMPDLKDDEVKEMFYGMIKDFFLNVPDEFRAAIQTPAEKGGFPTYIIVLQTASCFSNLDAGFVEYCNKRFAEDFGGRRLLWIGNSDFRPKAEVMDGYWDYGAGKGLKYDNTGWIDIAGVGPGYDNSVALDNKTPIRSRMDGDTYKKDWDALMTKPVDWVVVDSWNGLHDGIEICPSEQYGEKFISLTKINMLRFNGMKPYDAKYLKHDTPSVMQPNSLYQVTLTMKNAGMKPWYPGLEGVFLSCRWFKEGTLFADTSIRLPFQDTILAGQICRKTIGIRTVDQDGNPLPEGDYELRWDMVRSHDEWFSGGGDTPLCLPVKIGATVPGFTLVGSTLPTLMKSGATYNVTVKLRNDGPTAWKAGSAKIGYRWKDYSNQPAASNESAAVLQTDVEPGRIVEAAVPVLWQNDKEAGLLRWDVFDGEKWLAPAGVGCAAEAVKVTATDYGPRFITSDNPSEMFAGKQTIVNLTLVNTGTDTWTKSDFKVGYHWYYLDGIEAAWDGGKSSLPSDVRPGESAIVKASVTAPPCDGQYYLVWDLANGDTWASTTSNTRGGNTLVAPVKVIKGKLVAQDLSKLFDSDISSFDTNRKDGDADGTGLTFPAEFLLPDSTSIKPADDLWPCGMWTSVQGSEMESSRRISFNYPSKIEGTKNALICKGQSIELKSGKYAAVHVLVMSAQDTTGDFALVYGDRKSPVTIQMSAWSEAPKHGEHPAFVCLHRHSPDGDQLGQKCYLNHYVLQADPKTELTTLALPNNPAVKIVAVTLEK